MPPSFPVKKMSWLSRKPSKVGGGWSSVREEDGSGWSKIVLSALGALRLDRDKVCWRKEVEVKSESGVGVVAAGMIAS